MQITLNILTTAVRVKLSDCRALKMQPIAFVTKKKWNLAIGKMELGAPA